MANNIETDVNEILQKKSTDRKTCILVAGNRETEININN